jgi:transposase
MSGRSIEVHDLNSDLVRHDATTANGHHLVSEAGLFQFGHSKDDPNLPQVKIMVSNLDPLGLPLVTRTVSGERADDTLYLPTIIQTQETLGRSGLLHESPIYRPASDYAHAICGPEAPQIYGDD